MSKLKIRSILFAMIIVAPVCYYFIPRLNVNADLRKYNKFHNSEIKGIVDKIDIYNAYAMISVRNSDTIYYFVPANCSNQERNFEELPMLGDSVVKEKFSDRLYIYTKDSVRELCDQELSKR